VDYAVGDQIHCACQRIGAVLINLQTPQVYVLTPATTVRVFGGKHFARLRSTSRRRSRQRAVRGTVEGTKAIRKRPSDNDSARNAVLGMPVPNAAVAAVLVTCRRGAMPS
jgi:hypothetical protein